MREMLKLIRSRLEAGEDLVLVTVIASSGATPRGAGARMLIGREGRLRGTIGGGAVEYRSEQIAAQVLAEKTSRGHDFTLTKDDVQNLGMICGGAVEVFFHYIPAGDEPTIQLAAQAEELFCRGSDLWLISDLCAEGALSLQAPGESLSKNDFSDCLSRHPQRMIRDGRDLYIEQINSSGRVYIFGGGHVAQELEPVLTRVGFRCVVLEDRPEFADPALFPTAESVKLIDFTDIKNSVKIEKEDYVCVMTRGHAYDTVIQAQVLPCRPCYVGVIGSRQKAAGVRRTLKEDYGLSDTDLDLVTTPIGLDILAETPAEIAISIAAQMIAVRAERSKQ